MLLVTVFCADAVALARSVDMKAPCVNCHTMHNSQSGTEVSGIGTQGALLNNTCYGCHTGANTGSTDAIPKTPKVWHLSPDPPTLPPYMTTGTEAGHDTLAGGDFGWVAGVGNDLKGHNVIGISGTSTLTCAGSTGCHGDRTVAAESTAMALTHHSVETAQPSDGAPLSESYRWLDGVAGYEDPDYELSVSNASTNHNQYKGIARTAEGDSTTSSISNFCASCHGNFHNGSNPAGISDDASTFGTAGSWIRHPVDYAMPLTTGTEYAGYGKPTAGDYNVATPLGSVNVSTQKSTVGGVGDNIITCISCHRAHGSPYDYSLRWDYMSWPAAGYYGCGDCHTLKN